MLEWLAFAWLYLAGLIVFHRLQAFTTGRADYGAAFWPLLLAWPVVAPIAFVLFRATRQRNA